MAARRRDFCREQVGRLACLIGFPSEPRARQELLDVLLAVSFDDRHAKAIVDTWLESARFAPVPADLRAMARSTRPAAASPSLACESCQGTGWIYSPASDGVTRCTCLVAAIKSQEAREVSTA